MSTEFLTLTVGPLETNCYLLWDQDTRKAAIIDPGGERDRIVETVRGLGLAVEWILLTHGHGDHSFLAGDLASLYSARIGMHQADVMWLDDPLELAETYYDTARYVSFRPTDLLTDGDQLKLGQSVIGVLHTPGHSAGGLCFATEAGVFCGDALFAGAIGRTDFPGGSHDQLVSSIKTKLLTLDDVTPLYPGHGPATTVGQERRHNPYLQ